MLIRALLLLLVAFPAFAQPVAGPVTYRLDPEKSWIYVVVYNENSAMGMGHDHAMKAMDFSGTVVWDALDPTKCQIDITIPVQNLDPDPPGLREREKLPADEAVGEWGLGEIKKNFLGGSQLDAKNHPTINYKSTACAGGTDNKVSVTGNLTIRGKTKVVTTTMFVTPTPTNFAAGGVFKARATDFGFKPYSNLFGALTNKDEMKFVVDVVGAPPS